MGGRATGFPTDRRFLVVFTTGLLLVVAGCAAMPFGGPSEQEMPVPLVLNNSANVTTTFDVWQVELGAMLTLYYRDGTVVNATMGQGLSGTDTGPRAITEIKYPDSAQHYGQQTLVPGEEYRQVIENFSTNGVLVVAVSRSEDEIFSWVSANCGEQSLVGLKVIAYPNPPGGTYAEYECT